MNIEETIAALPDAERQSVERSAAVMLALRFSELAREECERAETDLLLAIDRALRAQAYLIRTTITLEESLQLHAIGRR